jgi:inosine-uridine nucleoside N-ribohydrolase
MGKAKYLPQPGYNAFRQTLLTEAISALYSLWFRHADWAVQPKMFDGVAVGMALWPELFEFEEMHVFVDDEGFTKVNKNKEHNCKVGVKTNKMKYEQIKETTHKLRNNATPEEVKLWRYLRKNNSLIQKRKR